jgi:hypothetical protein
MAPEWRNRTPACSHAPLDEVTSEHQPDSPRLCEVLRTHTAYTRLCDSWLFTCIRAMQRARKELAGVCAEWWSNSLRLVELLTAMPHRMRRIFSDLRS